MIDVTLPASERRRTGLLRLYVAGSTPNSTRAEINLLEAIKDMDGKGGGLELEIVDVFTHPKRALTDGVIVTPTLIGIVANGRKTMMGDLTDSAKLKLLLTSLQAAKSVSGHPP